MLNCARDLPLGRQIKPPVPFREPRKGRLSSQGRIAQRCHPKGGHHERCVQATLVLGRERCGLRLPTRNDRQKDHTNETTMWPQGPEVDRPVGSYGNKGLVRCGKRRGSQPRAPSRAGTLVLPAALVASVPNCAGVKEAQRFALGGKWRN